MWVHDVAWGLYAFEVPCGETAIGVTAHELFALMVPGDRPQCLKQTDIQSTSGVKLGQDKNKV